MGEQERVGQDATSGSHVKGKAGSLAAEIDAMFRREEFPALIAAVENAPGAIDGHAVATFQLGVAHATLGEMRKAAPLLKRALDLQPEDPAIMGALARVHILLGEVKEADALIAGLSSSARGDAAAAHHLAEVFLQAERTEEAFHLLAAAARKFKDPRLDVRLAEAAIRTRRNDIAIAAARRAEARLSLTPSVANIVGPVALILGDEAALLRARSAIDRMPPERAARSFDLWTRMLIAGEHQHVACRAAEMAAERAPTAERWRQVADLKLADRDPTGAERAAHAALAIQPNNVDGLSVWARARLFIGDVEEAKRIFLDAAALDPGSAVVWDNLTQIDAAAMSDEAAALLESRLAENSFNEKQKPMALLALARRNEANGDFKTAFDRIVSAKSMIARSAKAAGRGYNPRLTDATAEALTRIFTRPLGAASAPRRPGLIFVTGMPRSGTSLAEQILASHPAVFGAGERPEMMEIFNEFVAAAPTTELAKALIADRRASWTARYQSALPPEAHPADFVVDKHPLNFWSVGLIAALFPNAKFVNLTRSAIDVCLSILRVRFFTGYAFVNEVDSVAHYYAAYERMTSHWKRLFGDAFYDLNYEALVADPERETRALLAYCGLPWSAACLDFHETKRDVMTHSAAQVRQPMYGRAVERRAKYGDALKPLEVALRRYGVQAI